MTVQHVAWPTEQGAACSCGKTFTHQLGNHLALSNAQQHARHAGNVEALAARRRAYRRAWEKAEMAALRTLAQMHGLDFAVLFEKEKRRRGLNMKTRGRTDSPDWWDMLSLAEVMPPPPPPPAPVVEDDPDPMARRTR